MPSYLDSFFAAANDCFETIRRNERATIEEAGEAVANALASKGVWAVMDTGHLLRHEALIRAGGLMAIVPYAYELNVENEVAHRTDKKSAEEAETIEIESARLALRASSLRTGDVLLINSNSGRSVGVVETALAAKTAGIKTVGVGSRAQAAGCGAAHPSGKTLLELTEIAIDNHGPFGDAAVTVKDNEAMAPLSGMAAAYIFWAIQCVAVERLETAGMTPSIYRSVHVSGQDYIDEQYRRFLEQGF